MWVAWKDNVLGCKIRIEGGKEDVVCIAERLAGSDWVFEEFAADGPRPWMRIDVLPGAGPFDVTLTAGSYEFRKLPAVAALPYKSPSPDLLEMLKVPAAGMRDAHLLGDGEGPGPGEPGHDPALGIPPPPKPWKDVVADELAIRGIGGKLMSADGTMEWTHGDDGVYRLGGSDYALVAQVGGGAMLWFKGEALQAFLSTITAKSCAEAMHRRDLRGTAGRRYDEPA